ncbi:25462_t:CDS:2, partial [Gigaspora rosea]
LIKQDYDASYSHADIKNLNNIEEKYATLSSQPTNKKPRIALYQLFGKKASNEKLISVNFMDAISQVHANEHYLEPSNIIPTPETTNHIAISSNSNSQFTSPLDTTPTNNVESVTTVSSSPSASQYAGTKQLGKHSKSAKKYRIYIILCIDYL